MNISLKIKILLKIEIEMNRGVENRPVNKKQFKDSDKLIKNEVELRRYRIQAIPSASIILKQLMT